ncbi:MAG TPA: hypothetical protein VIG25_15000, partial [Pyrinomonadaceae bacterium]
MKRLAHESRFDFMCLITFLTLIAFTLAHAQDKSSSDKKRDVSQAARRTIPIVRVTPTVTINELPS